METLNIAPAKITLVQALEMIAALTVRVEALEAPKPSKASEKEMSEADAEAVTYGEFSALKHKEAAEKLNLTYGQVYSARLEFTFKGVHKAAKDAGKKNIWVK